MLDALKVVSLYEMLACYHAELSTPIGRALLSLISGFLLVIGVSLLPMREEVL